MLAILLLSGCRRCGVRTPYLASTLPEPSHVREASSRSETGVRPSNSGVPVPTRTGPIIRCNSSTRPLISRSFQSVRLPKTRMSLPVCRLSPAILSRASARPMMLVLRHGSVSSGVRPSDTTTFSMALLSRDISLWSGLASGSSATAGQNPLNPSYEVRPRSNVLAARSRSAL